MTPSPIKIEPSKRGKVNSLVIKKIREGVANLICASGCSCCRDTDGWEEAKKLLAYILRVPKYSDGSGYNFSKFKTKRKRR